MTADNAAPTPARVCRDCGADWKPVRRGECIECGSDAGPAPAVAEGTNLDLHAVTLIRDVAGIDGATAVEAWRALQPLVGHLQREAVGAAVAEGTDVEAVLAAVLAVHARYFDLDGQPGFDDTTPEPEDVWRYDRDFRAAAADRLAQRPTRSDPPPST